MCLFWTAVYCSVIGETKCSRVNVKGVGRGEFGALGLSRKSFNTIRFCRPCCNGLLSCRWVMSVMSNSSHCLCCMLPDRLTLKESRHKHQGWVKSTPLLLMPKDSIRHRVCQHTQGAWNTTRIIRHQDRHLLPFCYCLHVSKAKTCAPSVDHNHIRMMSYCKQTHLRSRDGLIQWVHFTKYTPSPTISYIHCRVFRESLDFPTNPNLHGAREEY